MDEMKSESCFAHLTGTAHEHHLFLQIALNKGLKVSLHEK
jgi:hypothetical protein